MKTKSLAEINFEQWYKMGGGKQLFLQSQMSYQREFKEILKIAFLNGWNYAISDVKTKVDDLIV